MQCSIESRTQRETVTLTLASPVEQRGVSWDFYLAAESETGHWLAQASIDICVC